MRKIERSDGTAVVCVKPGDSKNLKKLTGKNVP